MKFRLFTIPNLFTCLNLICGCLTIERAFSGDFLWAFGFTVLAAVMDFLDGFLARLLRSDSAVGKELDSLADVVSF
ncbi:MAG: CDP-alcohol phosphatidyltransferase family protein, partial [Rikenellaceae bacterium]|nr:CDP-alcohol phosphatidyltransferase family protein [Rikenellaceae bacterium]